ncbi:MAG: permease-like cell division protein FtsX [Clostridiales bacterium]|nr:permease-like cell division protein FtsX [Clostridiales bacterium]
MKKNTLLFILSISIISCVAIIASVSYLISCIVNIGTKSIEQSRTDTCKLTVFLDREADDIDLLGEDIQKIDGVKNCIYISADEAWEAYMREYFKDNPQLAEGFKDDNPLADSAYYEVEVDADEIENVINALYSLDGVHTINRI